MTVRTWAQCLRVERLDGEVIALADLDQDITYDSITYKANPSFVPTVTETTANLSVNNAETGGFLSLTGIPRTDLQAGLFDGARMVFLILDYSDSSLVKILGSGYLGESKIVDDSYEIEYRSLAQKMQQTIGRKYSKDCDARLGDSRCGVNLALFTVTGALTSVTSNKVVTDTSRAEVSGYFTYGNFTFTSGANEGLSQEVKAFSSGQFTFFLPFPFDVEIGDAYEVYAGCNKQLATCRDKFGNVINYQGFPDKPQRDKASKFGGQ